VEVGVPNGTIYSGGIVLLVANVCGGVFVWMMLQVGHVCLLHH
jgi:hypothetical protein